MTRVEALAQPEQEPVACGYDETTGNCTRELCCRSTPPQQQAEPEQEPIAQLECAYGYSQCKALEISQKKRSWVGLTDEEVNWFGWHGTSIRTIEAELKEKNT